MKVMVARLLIQYKYRKFHYGDKVVLRPSYLHNGISHTGKLVILYWISPQVTSGRVMKPHYPRDTIISLRCRKYNYTDMTNCSWYPLWQSDSISWMPAPIKQIWRSLIAECLVNPLCAELIWGNIKIYFQVNILTSFLWALSWHR